MCNSAVDSNYIRDNVSDPRALFLFDTYTYILYFIALGCNWTFSFWVQRIRKTNTTALRCLYRKRITGQWQTNQFNTYEWYFSVDAFICNFFHFDIVVDIIFFLFKRRKAVFHSILNEFTLIENIENRAQYTHSHTHTNAIWIVWCRLGANFKWSNKFILLTFYQSWWCLFFFV